MNQWFNFIYNYKIKSIKSYLSRFTRPIERIDGINIKN